MAGGGHDIPSASNTMNDWRYQGAFMGGRFTEKSQISIIANGNNTNNRGFNDLAGNMMNSMMGGGGGMGRGQGGFGRGGNGITTSWMGGVNGNWDLFDKKMELGANYLYNGSTGYAITQITTTNADYDSVKVGTTLGEAAAGAVLTVGSSTAASPAPKGLVIGHHAVEANMNLEAGIGVIGTVAEACMKTTLSSTQKAALTGIVFV